MSEIFTLGFDVGSTASKCIILKDGKEIVGKSLIDVGAGTSGPNRAIEAVLEDAGLKKEDMAFTLATGYGRTSLMDGIADKQEDEKVKKRLKNLKIKGISMTAQALSEAMIPGSGLNPYPRIKVTERPDYASACILEGKIGIVMDNSPGVMLLPVSFSDFTKEVDDYYFPPITGT